MYTEYQQLLGAVDAYIAEAEKNASLKQRALSYIPGTQANKAYSAAKSIGLSRKGLAADATGDYARNLMGVDDNIASLVNQGVDPATAREYVVAQVNRRAATKGPLSDLQYAKGESDLAADTAFRAQGDEVASQQAAARAKAEAARKAEAEAKAATQAAESKGAVQHAMLPENAKTSPQDAARNAGSAARSPLKTVAAAGTLGLGVGGAGYMAGKHNEQAQSRKNRNYAFGAGLTTGAVVPQAMKSVKGMLGGNNNNSGGGR